MNRRLAATAAVAAAVALAGPAGDAAAQTSTPSALGWWTRRPGAAPLEGGFEIAAGLQGAESVAAARLTVPDGAGSVQLVLIEDSAPDATAILACPAASTWEPADGGAWADQPEAGCDTASAEATESVDGRWTVDVSSFPSTGGVVDVVLMPAASEVVPGLGAPTAFTATFSGAEVTTAGGAAPPTSPRPAPSPTPSPGAVPRQVPVAPAPRPAPMPAVPTTAAPPTTLPADMPAGGGASVAAPSFDPVAGDGDDRPWSRLLVLVPLSAAVGLAAATARNVQAVRYERRRSTRSEPVADTSSNLPLASAGQ